MTDTPSTDGGIVVERRSPNTVFALLGDDIRVGIVQALGETPDETVPFAELRTRVGVEDSGQFNYHLGKLRDSLVRRTDDGYELTYAGRQILGAMHAGTYTANATVDPIPLEADCPLCGGQLHAEYSDETAYIACIECADWLNEFSFPPGSLDQFTREELPYAFDRWMYHTLHGVDAGFCYTCAGRMTGRLVVDPPEDRVGEVPAHVEYACERCGSAAQVAGVIPALLHPAVQGFLFEHGVDLSTEPSWHFADELQPETTLTSPDPPELTVRYRDGVEAVTAVVDATAAVTSVERHPVAE